MATNATAYRVGVNLEVQGAKEMKSSLTQLRFEMNNFNSELRKLGSAYDDAVDKEDNLQRQYEVHRKTLDALRKRISEVNAVLEEAKKKYGANSTEVNNLSTTLNKLQTMENQHVRSLREISNQLSENGKAIRENEENLKRYDSELQKNQARLDANKLALEQNSNSVNTLSERKKLLLARAETLTKEEKTLENQLKRVSQETGSTSDETAEYKERLEACKNEIKLVNSELKQTQSSLAMARTGFDNFKSAMNSIDDAIGNMSKKLTILGASLTATLTTSLTLTGKKAVEASSNLETYTKNLEVMTGSAEQAQDVVSQLRDFGLSTPYELPDLTETAQLMMNYGIDAQEAVRMVKLLGDVGMGSAEKLQHIALAYAQMKGSGKIMLQDINQMVSSGFSPLLEISEMTGQSIGELRDSVSDGGVTFEQITQAIEHATSEGGRYYNAMNQIAGTFQGHLSNFKESVDTYFLAEIGNVINPVLNQLMDNIGKVVMQFYNLEPATKSMVVGLGAIGAGLPPVITIIGALGMAMSALQKKQTEMVTSMGTMTVSVIEKFTSLKSAVNILPNAFNSVTGAVSDIFLALRNSSSTLAQSGVQLGAFGTGILSVKNSIADFATNAIANFGKVKGAVTQMVDIRAILNNMFNPSFLKYGLNDVIKAVQDTLVGWGNNLSGVLGIINGHFATFGANIMSGLSGVKNYLFTTFPQLQSFFTNTSAMISSASAKIGAVLPQFMSGMTGLYQQFGSAFMQMYGAIFSGMKQIIELVLSYSFQFVGAFSKFFAWGALIGLIVAGFGYLRNAFGERITNFIEYAQANAGTMITAWTESVAQKMPLMIQAGADLINQVLALINSILPNMINGGIQILSALVMGISQQLPSLLNSIMDVIVSIVTLILNNLDLVVSCGIEFLGALLQGIIQQAPRALELVLQVILRVVQVFTNNLSLFIQVGTQLIQELLNGIQTNLPRLIEYIPLILRGIYEAVGNNIDTIINASIVIINTLIDTLVKLIPEVIKVVPQIIQSMLDAFVTNLDKIVEGGIKIIDTLITAITDNLPTIIECAVNLIITIAKTLLENLPKIVTAGAQVIVKLAESLFNNFPKIIEAGIQIIGVLVQGAIQGIPLLLEFAGQIVKTIWDTITHTDWLELGKSILNGIINGLMSIGSALKDAVVGIGDSIIKTFKEVLQIHSPSRVMYRLGKNTVQGTIDSMKSMFPEVAKISRELGTTIQKETQRSASKVTMASLMKDPIERKKYIQAPEIEFSNMELPEITLPEIKAPTIEVPEVQMPEMPEIEVPKIETPTVTVPEINPIKMPQIQVASPDIEMPDISLEVQQDETMLQGTMNSMNEMVANINTGASNIQNTLSNLNNEIGIANQTASTSMNTTWSTNMNNLSNVITATCDNISNNIGTLSGNLNNIANTASSGVDTTIQNGMTSVQNTISNGTSFIQDNVSTTVNNVGTIVNNSSTQLQNDVSTLSGTLLTTTDNTSQQIQSICNNLSSVLINTIFANLSQQLQDIIRVLCATLLGAFDNLNQQTQSTINNMSDSVINIFGNMSRQVQDIINQLVTFMLSAFEDMKNQIIQKIGELVDNITGTMNRLPNEFRNVASSAMTEFINGMNDQKEQAKNTASDVVQTVLKAFKDGLGIASPAKEMFPIGKYTIQGFFKGMEKENLQKFVDNILNDIVGSFAGGKFNATQLVDFVADDTSINQLIERLKKNDYSQILGAGKNGGNLIFPTEGIISSYFGGREAPTAGASTNHGAIDIANEIGTAIVASLGGTVTASAFQGEHTGYGNYIRIDHGGGWETLYGHMIDRLKQVGDVVSQGELIAHMGSTGVSTGSHLHFGLFKDGVAVDPLIYLRGQALDGAGNGIGALIQNIQTAQLLKNGITAFGEGTAEMLSWASRLAQDSNRIGRYADEIDYSPYTGGGSLDQWIATALAMTGVSQDNAPNLKSLVLGESGGNPNIIQDPSVWDINWAQGNPARGISQTIPETFKRYMLNGMNQIYNPVHNLVASIRYQLATYGHILNHSGYAVGTRYVPSDMVTAIHKGEAILPANQNPYSRSGGNYLEELVEKVVKKIDRQPNNITVNQTFTKANPTPSEVARTVKNTIRRLNR